MWQLTLPWVEAQTVEVEHFGTLSLSLNIVIIKTEFNNVVRYGGETQQKIVLTGDTQKLRCTHNVLY